MPDDTKPGFGEGVRQGAKNIGSAWMREAFPEIYKIRDMYAGAVKDIQEKQAAAEKTSSTKADTASRVSSSDRTAEAKRQFEVIRSSLVNLDAKAGITNQLLTESVALTAQTNSLLNSLLAKSGGGLFGGGGGSFGGGNMPNVDIPGGEKKAPKTEGLKRDAKGNLRRSGGQFASAAEREAFEAAEKEAAKKAAQRGAIKAGASRALGWLGTAGRFAGRFAGPIGIGLTAADTAYRLWNGEGRVDEHDASDREQAMGDVASRWGRRRGPGESSAVAAAKGAGPSGDGSKQKVEITTHEFVIKTDKFQINGIDIGNTPGSGMGSVATGTGPSYTGSDPTPQGGGGGASPRSSGGGGATPGGPGPDTGGDVPLGPGARSRSSRSGGRVDPNTGVGERMKMIYDGFRAAGLSHDAAKVMTAETGRENSFNPKFMFGNHSDPYNHARNVGIMSWQGGRDTGVLKELAKAGQLNPDGSIKHTQEAIDVMTRYSVHEMQSGALGRKGKEALKILMDPNKSYQEKVEATGTQVYKWRKHDPRYGPDGNKRRDDWYRKAGELTDKSDAAKDKEPPKVEEKPVTPPPPPAAEPGVTPGPEAELDARTKKLQQIATKVTGDDPVLAAGLGQIGGLGSINRFSPDGSTKSDKSLMGRAFRQAAEGTGFPAGSLNGAYMPPAAGGAAANKLFMNDAARDPEQTMRHELGHAASTRYMRDMAEGRASMNGFKKWGPYHNSGFEEARQRMRDMETGHGNGEEGYFMREYTDAGFNPAVDTEMFRGRAMRENALRSYNDGMQEHYNPTVGAGLAAASTDRAARSSTPQTVVSPGVSSTPGGDKRKTSDADENSDVKERQPSKTAPENHVLRELFSDYNAYA